MTSRSEIRKALLNAGVRSLREFGYPDVNTENILTVEVFRAFFAAMLSEDRLRIGNRYGKQATEVIVDLLALLRPAGIDGGQTGGGE